MTTYVNHVLDIEILKCPKYIKFKSNNGYKV